MLRRRILAAILIGVGLPVTSAGASSALFAQCTAAMVKLRSAGVVQSLTTHGNNPRGFDLLVNQTKWRMIDPTTRPAASSTTANRIRNSAR
jgi:hypothetical protein